MVKERECSGCGGGRECERSLLRREDALDEVEGESVKDPG